MITTSKMSLSKVNEFITSIQNMCQSKQTKSFDSVAQKLSDEVNRKFISWKGKPTMIWKSIQRFHSDHAKFKLKELQFQIMKEVKENHPDKTNSEVDEIVKKLLKDGGFYSKHSKDRDQYLSEKAEHKVDEAISLIMLGHPGLLIRGLKCEGKTVKNKNGVEIIGTFSHLKEFLGDDIAPNCKGECGGKHQNECYNFEADIVLIYPTPDGKINVVLIEVKRSTDPQKISENLITEALVQLKKDTKFMLQLLPDVPSENMKINTFLALPETDDNVVADMFTLNQIPTAFMGNILTKTDFDSNKFRDKLKLNFCQSVVGGEITENVNFIRACARIRGHQNLTISNKEQKVWMLKYEENIEKQLIMFDEEQREVLNNFESNHDIKHFAFRGGSGTGKTIVALKCIDLLKRRYIKQGHTDIFVYALTCQEEPDRGTLLPLLQDFRDNISSCPTRCETMQELVSDFENLPIENLDQSIWHLTTWKSGPTDLVDRLQSLVESLKFIHQGNPIILFLDEIYESESHNLLGFDFSKFGVNGLLNIVMVFNPILQTHHSNDELEVPIHEPSSVGLITKTFVKRYRNSEKIQRLTKFVGNKLDIYLKTDEENASCVPGKYPVYIDLGFKSTGIKYKLERALKTVLELTEDNDIRLLYDGHFEEEVSSFLKKRPLNHFKKKIIVQDEKYYRGCESDVVVYIGSGHLEAFSRAKLELGIILCCNLSSFEDRYNKYRDALSVASEDTVKRIILKEENEMDDEDDMNQSEWSQWTYEPRVIAAKTNNFDINVQDYWRTAIANMDTTAAQIQANWSKSRHRPSVADIKRAALLCSEGHLTSVEYLNIEDIDITGIPRVQMEKLASIVTRMIRIKNITHAEQLGGILSGIRQCPDLFLLNMKLSELETRALVTAMRDWVQTVTLFLDVTLDIEELTKYGGRGRCRKLWVLDECLTRYGGDRLRGWAAHVGWTVNDEWGLVMKRRQESNNDLSPNSDN